MAPRTYDCYVRLAHVSRNERLLPAVSAYRTDDPDFFDDRRDWRELVTAGTLAVWLVQRSQVTHAKDLVLAHLAGYAPYGVTKLYDKARPVPQEGGYLVKGGVTHDFDPGASA